MASPGKIQDYTDVASGAAAAKLFNFDVGKSILKPEHSLYLLSIVAPRLTAGGSINIIGFASRTGPEGLNQKLSEARVKAVIDLLGKTVPNNFKVAFQIAAGERAAAYAGVENGKEDENWRGVILSLWNKREPPPVPVPPPPPPPHVYDPNLKRWIGYGYKIGGQGLIAGFERTRATVYNLGDLESFDLDIGASRWGLGLGGAGGLVAVIGWGFSVPYEMHRQPEEDWGINIAFTRKILGKSTVQAIRASKLFLDGFKHGKYVRPVLNDGKFIKGWVLLQNIRDALHVFYKELESNKKSGFIILDLPIGIGLEVSAFLTRGTIYIDNPSNWVGPDEENRL